jgi:Cu/Ag efflux protein CusF
VREVGFEPAQGAPGIKQDGVITNLDVNVGHVVVQLATGTNTFAVEPKDQLRNFKIGDKVSILIETRPSGQEIVTQINRR